MLFFIKKTQFVAAENSLSELKPLVISSGIYFSDLFNEKTIKRSAHEHFIKFYLNIFLKTLFIFLFALNTFESISIFLTSFLTVVLGTIGGLEAEKQIKSESFSISVLSYKILLCSILWATCCLLYFLQKSLSNQLNFAMIHSLLWRYLDILKFSNVAEARSFGYSKIEESFKSGISCFLRRYEYFPYILFILLMPFMVYILNFYDIFINYSSLLMANFKEAKEDDIFFIDSSFLDKYNHGFIGYFNYHKNARKLGLSEMSSQTCSFLCGIFTFSLFILTYVYFSSTSKKSVEYFSNADFVDFDNIVSQFFYTWSNVRLFSTLFISFVGCGILLMGSLMHQIAMHLYPTLNYGILNTSPKKLYYSFEKNDFKSTDDWFAHHLIAPFLVIFPKQSFAQHQDFKKQITNNILKANVNGLYRIATIIFCKNTEKENYKPTDEDNIKKIWNDITDKVAVEAIKNVAFDENNNFKENKFYTINDPALQDYFKGIIEKNWQKIIFPQIQDDYFKKKFGKDFNELFKKEIEYMNAYTDFFKDLNKAEDFMMNLNFQKDDVFKNDFFKSNFFKNVIGTNEKNSKEIYDKYSKKLNIFSANYEKCSINKKNDDSLKEFFGKKLGFVLERLFTLLEIEFSDKKNVLDDDKSKKSKIKSIENLLKKSNENSKIKSLLIKTCLIDDFEKFSNPSDEVLIKILKFFSAIPVIGEKIKNFKNEFFPKKSHEDMYVNIYDNILFGLNSSHIKSIYYAEILGSVFRNSTIYLRKLEAIESNFCTNMEEKKTIEEKQDIFLKSLQKNKKEKDFFNDLSKLIKNEKKLITSNFFYELYEGFASKILEDKIFFLTKCYQKNIEDLVGGIKKSLELQEKSQENPQFQKLLNLYYLITTNSNNKLNGLEKETSVLNINRLYLIEYFIEKIKDKTIISKECFDKILKKYLEKEELNENTIKFGDTYEKFQKLINDHFNKVDINTEITELEKKIKEEKELYIRDFPKYVSEIKYLVNKIELSGLIGLDSRESSINIISKSVLTYCLFLSVIVYILEQSTRSFFFPYLQNAGVYFTSGLCLKKILKPLHGISIIKEGSKDMDSVAGYKIQIPEFYYLINNYKFTIFRNLNIDLMNGVYLLAGPSGSGKTTLISLLLGFCPVQGISVSNEAGEIFDLLDVRGDSIRSNVSNIPQTMKFRFKTIEEFFELFDPDFDIRIAQFLMTEFNMKNIELERQMSTLSGGQRQRVSIIAALLQFIKKSPNVVFADESTFNIDYLNRMKIYDIFFKYLSRIKTIPLLFNRSREVYDDSDELFNNKLDDVILEKRAAPLTILFTSHTLGEVAPFADKLIQVKPNTKEVELCEVISKEKEFANNITSEEKEFFLENLSNEKRDFLDYYFKSTKSN